MPPPFAEYFASKGAVELFCVINPIGSTFGELAAAVTVARGTLNRRLHEAVELGLITKVSVTEGINRHERWVMTERGMKIYKTVGEWRIPLHFDEYRDTRRTFEQKREDFALYVSDDAVVGELAERSTSVYDSKSETE